MAIVLGIESTAHTFGVGIVKNGKVLANAKRVFTTDAGGMIPIEVAKCHCENKNEVYFEALTEAKIKEGHIDAVAFSQGPGLAPCLLEGMKFAKELSKKLKKPLVPINHCIAHLEIGTQGCTPKRSLKKRLLGAKTVGDYDPVMLYASGANTQVIAYSSGKYRIFGETLDMGVGNFIDSFARYAGIGFPGGPVIEKLALTGKNYIELPYSVKGMDVTFSGILTNLRKKLESKDTQGCIPKGHKTPKDIQKNISTRGKLNDLCYSLQETVFAMLVETAERALAHTGKKELLLGGGVACNSRLQEMCKIMCKERGAKCFIPEKQFLVDNGAMIAYLGEIMFNAGIKEKNLDKVDIHPRERTDDVEVRWK